MKTLNKILLLMTCLCLFTSVNAFNISHDLNISTVNGNVTIASGNNTYTFNSSGNSSFITTFTWNETLSADTCKEYINATILDADCASSADISLICDTITGTRYNDLKNYFTTSLMPDTLALQNCQTNVSQCSADKQRVTDRVTSLESENSACMTDLDSAKSDTTIAEIFLGLVLIIIVFITIVPNFFPKKMNGFGGLQ